ncbi:YfcC family protein [Calditrichota bacterium]
MKALSKLKSPNTFLILSMIMALTAALTWIIPSGEYQTFEKNGQILVMPDSYHYVESNPQGIGDLFMGPLNGFVDAALIIGFILVIGGVFYVFKKTEAVDSAIKSIAKAHKTSRLIQILVIPIFMIIFSLAGAVFGMSEEIIPFVLLFIPLALALGYDSIIGLAIPFVGAGAGFAAAFINPFTLGVAQGIAELPPLSGFEYRVIAWFVVTGVTTTFVYLYAQKIKKNPNLSITYKTDIPKKKQLNFDEIDNFKGIDNQHKLVMFLFLLGLVVMVYGVLNFGWYILEISAVFLITGIIVGIAGKLTINEITDSFIIGVKDLASTALVVALARGILVIARDGKIIDSILYALSNAISSFHPIISAQAMFIVQTCINFFIPSGSGQAALTMPIMAPLGDLVGVSRQTAVLAFQFGDGFSNMIIPTSGVTMGVLSLAGIPWEKWARWILPLEIILILVGFILLIPPFLIQWH